MNGPIPARVDETVKRALLVIIADAMEAGWSLDRVCGVLELDRRRVWRWNERDAAGTLADRAPGGNPIHGLLDWEETIRPLGLFMQMEKSKGILDGGEHGYKRTLVGTLPNKDFVLKSEA